MARQITPDEDDENVVIGRFLHEERYPRGKKEVEVGRSKVDLVRREGGTLVVSEVKKSSRFLQSARMQVLFYLKELKERGVEAEGELLFPEERKRERVILTEEALEEVLRVEEEIRRLVNLPAPPPPKKISFCRKCAYGEYCWA